MEKITEFNRTTLPIIRKKLNEILTPLGKELGIDFSAGNISFTKTNASIKVGMTTIQNGVVFSKERQDFKIHAGMYGLRSEDIDKSFITDSDTYTITGLGIRRRKYPIIAENSSGKSYIFSAETVKRALANK